MAYTVVYEPPLIRVAIRDALTLEVMIGVLAELEASERVLPTTPDRLFDLTTVSGGTLTFAEVLRIAGRRTRAEFPNPFRTAIVAASPSSLGFARMFQTLIDHPQITIETFESLDAAEAWLAGSTGSNL